MTSSASDCISKLADDLLCHILGYLPTNTAVSTSVLSQRWRYVWTGTPILQFTYKPPDDNKGQSYNSWKNCIRQLILHNNGLYSDRLDVVILDIHLIDDLSEWFSALSLRTSMEINFFYKMRHSHLKLPLTALLTGVLIERLIALQLTVENSDLYWAPCFKSSSMLYLPKLEKLHLSGVYICRDAEPLSCLLDGAPVLSELIMDNCLGHNDRVTFHCSTLKILKIKNIRINATIIAPNLEYLELGFTDEFFYVLKMDIPSLMKAKLSNAWIAASIWEDLLRQVSHVHTLYLSLEENFIENGMLIDWIPILMVPDNLGLSLEYFEICDIGRSSLTAETVEKYLLARCILLKEMKIHVSVWQTSESKTEIVTKLSEVHRPCKITIY